MLIKQVEKQVNRLYHIFQLSPRIQSHDDDATMDGNPLLPSSRILSPVGIVTLALSPDDCTLSREEEEIYGEPS